MTPLRQMSYEEFGKLRFLDFFPKTDAYIEDHDGGPETGIGLACTEGYLDTKFTSPFDAEWQTSEMELHLGRDCPETEGCALLDGLGLPLRKEMTEAQVKAILGVPESETKQYAIWLRFVLGEIDSYYVGCLVYEGSLCRVWICRKDLADLVFEVRR